MSALSAKMQRRLSAILVADVVGYSRLMGLDEAGTLERLQQARRTGSSRFWRSTAAGSSS